MKGRRALHRSRARGFTLFELVVVVLIISIVALLATPAFSSARNDRVAFDYARQYQQIIEIARRRSTGTGSAHLIVLGPGAGRGVIRTYEALDGQPKEPLKLVGPNPVASCKELGQWTTALTDPPVSSSTAKLYDWVTLDRAGVNDDMNVKAALFWAPNKATASAGVNFVAVCVTPNGTTYVGVDADSLENAIGNMRNSSPSVGTVDVQIQRHLAGGAGTGLKRHVLLVGGTSPRLRSE